MPRKLSDKKTKMVLLIILISAISLLILSLFAGLSPRDRSILFQKTKTFSHSEMSRSYLVSAPRVVNEETRIIVGLHGFSDSARRFAYYSGLHNAAGKHDIVIYPQAIKPQKNQKTGWNAGFCCGSGWIQKTDDVGFVSSLVRTIKNDNNINNAKVYIAGFSNGSFMAQRIAIETPREISGVVVVSGTIGTSSSRLMPVNPVPILITHGEQDNTIPLSGGIKTGDPDFDWLSHQTTLGAWQSVNKNQAQTKSITYPNNGHKWDDWRLVNFWHKKPQASKDTILFFDSL